VNEEERRDFTEFVEACAHSLFRTAMGLTGDRQQAEDLLQTVLAKAARHWGRIQRADQPAAYVRRSLYHENVSWWRRLSSRREHVVPAFPDRADPRDETATVDLRLSVAAGLRRLGHRQRAVLVMRYFDDLPDVEIAKILGCGEGTVRSQAARALARLRVLCPELDDQFGYQEATR
jgi:RNA polymerase sigma-70 factor (sigma-E family)